MANWSGMLLAAATLTFLGLFFQVVGFVLPWWFVIGDGLYIGIWYTLYCRDGIAEVRNCTAFTYNSIDSISEYNGSAIGSLWYFTALQVCTTVAVGLVLFCALGFICGGCGCCKSKVGYVWGCVFLFLSGIALFLAIGFFAWIYANTLVSLAGYDLKARSFPWSIVASGLGSIFTIFAGIILAVGLCRWDYDMYDDDDDDYDDRGHRHVPMSQMDNKRGYDNHGYPGYSGSYGNEKHQYQQQNYGNQHRYVQSSNHYGYSSHYAQPQSSSPYRQTSNMYRPIAASTKRDRY